MNKITIKDLSEIIEHAKSKIESFEVTKTVRNLREFEQHELNIQHVAVEYCYSLMRQAHNESR